MAGLEVFNDRAKRQNSQQGLPAGYLDWALNVTNGNPNLNGAVFPNVAYHNNDYNYQAAFNADTSAGANGHLSDIGKRPNHPTYSNESAYAWGGDPNAGSWQPSLGAALDDNSQAPWYYHNPSRGLVFAPEQQAYQHQEVPRTYQIFKSAPSVLDRFK